MLILYFYIFQRGFEVLDAIFQASVYVAIVTICIIVTTVTICTTVIKFFDILLVVELLIYIVKNIFSFSRIKTIHLFTNP